MSLRDALLESLKLLPGTREFHLHVLVSAPRKFSGLFPFAYPRPKTYLQDVIILLSEQPTPDASRLLVTAIEVSVYHIPSTSSAILYVSKVDSTGQAMNPSPTPTLVRSLLTFYADPKTRPIPVDHLWIQLFARAQGQYLFPNSSEYSGKRPLSDVKLCAWWKRLLTMVVLDLTKRTSSGAKTKMYYILPGYSELEASQSLGFASTAPPLANAPDWIYGHPYSQGDIPLPCPPSGNPDSPRNLGHCIPSFDDDPKNRFMDEIAYTPETDGVKSPQRKRTRTISKESTTKGLDGEEKAVADKKDDHPPTYGDIAKVTADEFWERMSFRQECVAGAVTGFFAVGITSPIPKDSSGITISPLAPQPGQVSSNLIKRIMTSLLTCHEFSTRERTIRATETLENAVKGLCDGLAITPPVKSLSRPGPDRPRTPEPDSRPTVPAVSTPPRRIANSRPPTNVISPNPFPEPVASLETYVSHIYGSVCVSNPALLPKAIQEGGANEKGSATPNVTILAVRKKKKRTES